MVMTGQAETGQSQPDTRRLSPGLVQLKDVLRLAAGSSCGDCALSNRQPSYLLALPERLSF